MNFSGDVTVQRITSNIGAVIGGVDLTAPLAEEQVAVVRQALLDHGVIFFRDQDITRPQFWAFMENFGQPRREETAGTDHDRPEDVTSVDMKYTRYSTAQWHSDVTSMTEPPKATAVRAVSVPPFGGDTCWSSMVAAWEALTPPFQRMLDGLKAVHSIAPLVGALGEHGPEYERQYTPRHAREQVHPVALTHPETGRKALYVNETFTTRILGLDRLESIAVLNFLFRHVERPDFALRWKWKANDLAFWDNRAVQHYAVPDYTTARIVQRIVLTGDKPGENASPTAKLSVSATPITAA